jgi:virginiamycin B lyase
MRRGRVWLLLSSVAATAEALHPLEGATVLGMSKQPMVRAGARIGAWVAAVVLVIAVLAAWDGGSTGRDASASVPSPVGMIFWAQSPHGGSSERGTVGRASLDGAGVDQHLIGGTLGGGGVAVEGGHVYWTNYGETGVEAGTIGRANLDGTDVNERFITGVNWPVGVAVDGRHIYWTDFEGIGRANLDGTGVNKHFIATYSPSGLAIDAQHIYWTSETGDQIGRANLDGTGVDQHFITATNAPDGVAVDAHYLYWSNTGDDTIGRARLSGTDATERCIAIANVPIGNVPEGLALDSQHVYWSNYPADSIARANLDGTSVNEHFDTIQGVPEGVAIDTNPTIGASPADLPPCPPSRAPILLGPKHYEPGPYAEGWGEAAPATISNGGASASGTVSSIHWSSWGGNVAVGHGLNPIFKPQGGYYSRPAVIELRASVIKRCTPGGPLVYTRFSTREPSKPGGPFGSWSAWASNMCA